MSQSADNANNVNQSIKCPDLMKMDFFDLATVNGSLDLGKPLEDCQRLLNNKFTEF